MTREGMLCAARGTIILAMTRGMDKTHPDGPLGYLHIVGMLEQMQDDPTGRFAGDDGKIGRWLGWMQAALVAAGVATFEEMKKLNKRYAA